MGIELSDDEWAAQFAPEDTSNDAWTAARTADAADAVTEVIVATPDREMFGAELSLWLTSHPWAPEIYWEQHRDKFPKVRDVLVRVDWAAANALERERTEQRARELESVLDRIQSEPRRPGLRQDADLVHHLVQVKPNAMRGRRGQVYQLCFQRGFSLHQCAEALGIGRETVRTHLRRLRSEFPAAWRTRDSK